MSVPSPTGDTTAAAPAVWWSQSKAAMLVEIQGTGRYRAISEFRYDRWWWGDLPTFPELPADAVRLVPAVSSSSPDDTAPVATLAIVRDLVNTLAQFIDEHPDPGTAALGVLHEGRRFISTGGTGHVEDSAEVDAIAETINAVFGMSVSYPKLMAAARGVQKLREARAAASAAVPDTAPAPGYDRIAQAITNACDAAEVSLDVHSGLNLYSPAQGYQRLARILDKAGLIDWTAFTDPVTADGPTIPLVTGHPPIDHDCMFGHDCWWNFPARHPRPVTADGDTEQAR